MNNSVLAVELELTSTQQHVVSFNSEQNLLVSAALKNYWIETGGIELIVAGSSEDNVEGQFGHLALRLIGSGANDLTDLVIEALGIPNEEDGQFLVKYRGIVGKYPIIFHFTDTKQQIKEYYKNEVRGYYRLPLPSNVSQRRELIENIVGISEDQFRDKTYRFFSQNCATFMLELLESSGFMQTKPVFPMRPTQVFAHFRKSFLTPWPENTGVNVFHLRELAKALTLGRIKKLDTLSLQRIAALSADSLDDSLRDRVSEEIKSRPSKYDASVVYDVKRYPEDFYQLNIANSSIVEEFLKDNFDKKNIRNVSIYNRASMTTLYPGQFDKRCKRIETHCKYFERGSLLLQEVITSM